VRWDKYKEVVLEKWKVLVVGAVALALMLGGGYAFTQVTAPAQAQGTAPAEEALERIAAALERIAAAMERGSGRPGIMGGMMPGMGSMMGPGMMQPQGMPGMGMMGGTPMGGMMNMANMMGPMMQACQQMMGRMASGMGPGAMGPGMMGQAPVELSEASLTRTSREAGIEVSATYMNLLMAPEETGGRLIFKLALNTHSGNLLQFDLTKLAVLHTSEGISVDKGFIWEPLSESGHHRLGYLEVGATLNGRPLIGLNTQYIELELKGIGTPSRVFKWELAPSTLGP
jgi:hypothetical protein